MKPCAFGHPVSLARLEQRTNVTQAMADRRAGSCLVLSCLVLSCLVSSRLVCAGVVLRARRSESHRGAKTRSAGRGIVAAQE